MVRSIEARGFRNLAQARLDLGDGITLVAGPNGAGKTNLLEALYFGLTGASWRARDDRGLIAFGADLARVEVEVESAGERRRFLASASRSEGKHRLLDGKPLAGADRAARPLLGVFSPDRLELVKGPPGVRRAHLDRVVGALWPARADARRRYGKALAQRNALLARVRAGRAPESSLDAWDRELAGEGAALIAARRGAVERLAPRFSTLAAELGLEGEAGLRYAPRTEAEEPARLAEELAERRGSDLERGFTSHGPHLDELELSLGDRSLRRFGSQGEQRSALLALLFSERQALIEDGAGPPVMLLDDVMSELDTDRRELLTETLAGTGQALITATEAAQLPDSCVRTEVRVRGGRLAAAALAA